MKRLIPVLAFLIGASAYAQAPTYGERGLPIIRHYAPSEYGGQHQNWDFAQHPDGSLVVANSGGVLIFNGAQWNMVSSPLLTTIRSVAVDPGGTIWVGGQGQIGYLAPDSLGALEFISIKDQLPPDTPGFTDVWGIIATEDEVYFQTHAVLIRKRGEEITVWSPTPDTNFFPLFLTGGEFYITEIGAEARGLLKVEGDELIPVGGDARLPRAPSRFMLRESQDSLLILDRLRLFHILSDDDTIRPIETEIDTFIREREALGGRVLSSKHIAVWTYAGGVALVSREGKLLDVLDETSGLPSSMSYTAYSDREGGLWLGQDVGISRVEPFTGVSVFNSSNGLIGNIWRVRRFNDELYVATVNGVFRLKPAAPDGSHRAYFERVGDFSWPNATLFSTEQSLLIGSTEGLFEWRNESLRKLLDQYVTVIFQSSIDPDQFYIAGRDGLIGIRRSGPTWSAPVIIDALAGYVVTSIAEVSNGDLWIGTRSDGFLRWSVDAAPGSPLIRYGEEYGIPPTFTSVTTFDDRLLFLTSEGLRHFDEETNTFLPDSLFGLEIAHGDRWLFGVSTWAEGVLLAMEREPSMELVYAVRMPDGTYSIDVEHSVSGLIGDGFITELYAEDDGVLWVGFPGELLRYAYHEQVEPEFPDLATRVEAVYAQTDSLLYGGYGPYQMNLNPGTSALRFVYAATTFHRPESIRYRVRLAGLERNWSAWTSETQKDYTNLSAGSYTFHVEAEDPLGRMITPVEFSFVIKPFWYETLPVRGVFFLLLLAAGAVIAQRGPNVARRIWARLPHKQVVSHYRLEEMIGSGGAGQVWRARDLSARTGDPREVAVKLLHVRIDPEDSQGYQRLRREADLLASFEHPNIVRVYEAGVWKSTPFVAMDLLQGETLRRRIQEHGPLSMTEALSVFAQLGDALKTVHEASVIHRDVKSENIMLIEGDRMQPVLMDFGLARGTHLTTLTQLGQLLGTLGYVAPEQAMGQDADARSDIFSFGVVMYETLVGRLPFVADNEIGMLHAIFNQEPPPPGEFVGDIPAWLDSLVMACLSKEPSERPGSMSEVLDRLAAD